MKTFDNRIVMLQALVGSHNYNLNTESSDKDYKAFVAPTFDDLYSGNKHSNQIITETEDYSVHDIRKLPELLFKANINFMEVLASDKIYLGNVHMAELEGLKDHIFRMNLPQFYKACHGMFRQKMGLLRKGTEGTQHLVDEFGYDTKQALHAYRSIRVPVDFEATGFNDFHSAIRYSGEEQKFMMSIRNGFFELEVFENFIEHYYESTFLKLDGKYISQPVDMNLKDELESIVKEAVEKHVHIK